MNSIFDENIIVIGDSILDINHYCNTFRNAAEANIPVYNIYNTEYLLGGAANVANNLNNFTNNIIFLSVIGDDYYGNKITNMLESKNICNKLFIDSSRSTTQKNRLFYNNSIVNRHDIENTEEISETIQNNIFDYICSLSNISAIIISDYAKGVIASSLCKKIIEYSNNSNIFTFVDPKIDDYEKYKNCFCFKPNLSEGSIISNSNDIESILSFIKNNILCENVLLTCSKDGMYLNNIKNHIQHSKKVDVVDVTGCGDTVLCVIVYMYLLDNDMMKACKIANYIAGKAVGVMGNFQILLNDINDAIQNIELDNKIIYDNEIEKMKNIGYLDNVVFTNGCFDIIHSAHIKLLKYAKSLGKILVVGLNSDSSVKEIKGEKRPINNEIERSQLLINIGWVDFVIIFNDNTPYFVLENLKPDILVKGGDYNIDQLVGKEFVKEVVLFDYIKGSSTTNIINSVFEKNKL